MSAILLALALLGWSAGCALFVPQETLCLRSAQDRATLAEVKQRLGEPRATIADPAGDPVLVCQVRVDDPGSRWSWTGMGCDEYVLTFDRVRATCMPRILKRPFSFHAFSVTVPRHLQNDSARSPMHEAGFAALASRM